MIFVLLGTNPYPFTRLLVAVDAWARDSGKRVVAQTGHTPVSGLVIECHPFLEHDEVLDYIAKAELVISQGGFGSLKDCLSRAKPVIAIPRNPLLGESQDDQSELVRALAHEDRVMAVEDMYELPGAIARALAWEPKGGDRSRIPEIVAAKVSEMLAARWR